MEIVKETGLKIVMFECPKCGKQIRGRANEMQFVDKGLVGCDCPGCGKKITVKEKKLNIIPEFETEKTNKQNQKKEA